MSITTQDCVRRITSYLALHRVLSDPKMQGKLCGPHDWRKKIKNGNKSSGFFHVFVNKKYPSIRAVVRSNEYLITKISFREGNVNLLQLCKNHILNDFEDDCISVHRVISSFLYSNMDKWPKGKVKENGKIIDDNGDDIGSENIELIDINKNKMVIESYGDWQVPLKFSASLKNDILTYNGDAKVSLSETGLSTVSFLKKVFGSSKPKELKGMEISDV